jgi:hypothetical protein
MQINFYMSAADREAFHDYLFSRDAYLTPQRCPSLAVPVFTHQSEDIDLYRTLHIYRQDIFCKEAFSDPSWLTFHPVLKSYYVHGPGMQYETSYTDQEGLHRGRIYMGLVSRSSFVPPKMTDPDAYARYDKPYRALENFYKSCCRYIRKNFRRDDWGMYHGAGSDYLVESQGIKQLQF